MEYSRCDLIGYYTGSQVFRDYEIAYHLYIGDVKCAD